MTMKKEHILSLVAENKFGVLAKVAGLFSIRGYNIDSFSVGPTDDPSLSKMTIVVQGDERTIEQITKQLHKLIDVVKVFDLSAQEHIEKELCFVKIHTARSKREEITHLAKIAGASVVDVEASSIIFEIVNTKKKIDHFLDLMKPFGIQDTVRSGTVAIGKE